MTKAFLALDADFDSSIISINSKNLVIFTPFADEKAAEKALRKGKENELFKEMIDSFSALGESADFIVVKPCPGIAGIGKIELNLQIARNLNVPVFCRENLSFFTRNSKLIVSGNLDEILNAKQDIITPLRFENSLFKLAAKDKKTVVLPESEDERILRASEVLLKSGAVNLILLGDENKVKFEAEKLGVNLNGEWCVVIDGAGEKSFEKITQEDILSLEIAPKIKAKLLSKISGEPAKEIYKNLIR